ncbi:MAG: peptidoglycan-binding domain-containing protein [Betaproteobacteria bacterium]
MEWIVLRKEGGEFSLRNPFERSYGMKARVFLIAGLTAFSMAAYAGGGAKHSQSESGTQQQSSAQQGSSQQQGQGQNERLVKQAQEKLNVQADGKIGPQTQAALKDFQKSKGLEASGQLDQQTVAALGISEGGQSAATGGTGSGSTGSSSGSTKY